MARICPDSEEMCVFPVFSVAHVEIDVIFIKNASLKKMGGFGNCGF